MASRPDSDPWQEDQDSHRRRAREPRPSQVVQLPRRAPASRGWRRVVVLLLALLLGLTLGTIGLPFLPF